MLWDVFKEMSRNILIYENACSWFVAENECVLKAPCPVFHQQAHCKNTQTKGIISKIDSLSGGNSPNFDFSVVKSIALAAIILAHICNVLVDPLFPQ